MKALVLARVSTEDQLQEGYTIPAQIQRAHDYCARKNLEIQSEHQFDESSSTDQRKKFDAVIAEVRASKEPVALVVETVDRLQRSFRESVALDELRKTGTLEIHFIRENLVVHKDSNSSEIQRWDLAVFVAKSYVLQLSDNVKRSFEQKRRNGDWTGKAPIGYMNSIDITGRKTIVVDPTQGPLIKRLFELYSSGNYSIRTLREKIVSEGLKSPLGKRLAPSMVEHILKNSFYYGEMRSKGKLYPHRYEPLVTKLLFDRCASVRTGWAKKPFLYKAKPYVLRGALSCKNCGCTISPEMHKGHVYYSCTNAKGTCKKTYTREEELLEPVYEIMDRFSGLDEKTIGWIVESLRKTSDTKNKYHQNIIASLRKRYDLLQAKAQRLLDLLIDGDVSKADYDAKLIEIKREQKDINLQMEEHTKADENFHVTAGSVLGLARRAKDLFNSSEVREKQALLRLLFQNSVVDGKKPIYSLRSPFDTILAIPQMKTKLRG